MKKLLVIVLALFMFILPLYAFADEEVFTETFDKINEEGSPEGWTLDRYVADSSYIGTDTDSSHGKCLHLVAPSKNDVRAIYSFDAKPDTYYKISGYVKTKGVCTDDGAKGATISVLQSYAYSEALTGDNEWTYVEVTGKTDTEQTQFSIALRIGGYSADSYGEAWFDDIKVEKLSEDPVSYWDFFMPKTENNDEDTQTNQTSQVSTQDIAAAFGIVVALFLFGLLIYKWTEFVKKKDAKTLKPLAFSTPTDTKLHMKKIDYILVIALTVIYGIVALVNLGTTQAPSTAWQATSQTEAAVIKFDKAESIKTINVFGGIADGGMVTLTDDDGSEICTYEQKFGEMYRWHKIYTGNITTSSVTIKATGALVDFKEISFDDADHNHIIGKASGSGAALVDEPDMIPDEYSCRNGMYFDELYHARTGYENVHNLPVYEVSHPPLGKILISLGIRIFGMNAFGWRVVGTVFGIFMLPVLYCFTKYIFKKTKYAFLSTFVFAFDFMHYAQTRIATIDVYGVFFILLMFFFMYKYFTMNFFRDGLGKTLVPLGIAGIFFGIGSASKWICIYAGAGLAVMLLLSFIQRFAEYASYTNSGSDEEKAYVSAYWKNVILTCLFCCVFFIIIPVAIYSASYCVYPNAQAAFRTDGIMGYLKEVWANQQYMFGYHSKLKATHTYQSLWYEWMLDLRPMWFSIDYYDNGVIGTISTFGNPVVWWTSLALTIGLIIQLCRGKIKMNETVAMILIGILANLVPWMIISRCVFIYHYFATVPFLIIGAFYFIKSVEEENKWFESFKWLFALWTIILFAVFYPVLSGMKITNEHAICLEWFKSWWFVGNQAAQSDKGVWLGIAAIAIIAATFIALMVYSKKHLKGGIDAKIMPFDEDVSEKKTANNKKAKKEA